MLDHIKAHLLNSINDIVSTANQFVLHPEKDFSRQSQLAMKTESSIMKLATSPCLKIFVLLSFSKPVISFDNRLETVRLSSQG